MNVKVGDKVRYTNPDTQTSLVVEVLEVTEEESLARIQFGKFSPGWVGFEDLTKVGIPNDKHTNAGIIGVCALLVLTGFGLGLLVNFNGADPHTPDVLCNNMSANDGPQYDERDITAYEFDKYCR